MLMDVCVSISEHYGIKFIEIGVDEDYVCFWSKVSVHLHHSVG